MTEHFYASCEERNYANDHRVRVVFLPEPPKGVTYHWEVCPGCEGRGTMVNPSIDAGGLTAEDFADDPDFADDYRSGKYDMPCSRCRGRTTIPVVDALPKPWRVARADGEYVVFEGDVPHASYERRDAALAFVFTEIEAE